MQVEDIKETRNGLRVRIICIDAKIGNGDYNIVGLIKLPDGTDFIEWWDGSKVEDGYIRALHNPSDRDLKL